MLNPATGMGRTVPPQDHLLIISNSKFSVAKLKRTWIFISIVLCSFGISCHFQLDQLVPFLHSNLGWLIFWIHISPKIFVLLTLALGAHIVGVLTAGLFNYGGVSFGRWNGSRGVFAPVRPILFAGISCFTL